MATRAYSGDSTPSGFVLSEPAPKCNAPWAVVLAGGDGTRLQRLTLQISGDTRPKQFCKLMGGDTLLAQTSRRITPLFQRDRQLYVVTRAHHSFYRDELSVSKASLTMEQPCNRGTAIAIGVAALRLLDCETDPLVAFFPSDHHYSDEGAFGRAVKTALAYSRRNPKAIVLWPPQHTAPRSNTDGSSRAQSSHTISQHNCFA